MAVATSIVCSRRRTQETEAGTVYGLDELAAISQVCHHYGMKLHMDGARFANALVARGCSPAEATWKADIDILSFGATKNGALASRSHGPVREGTEGLCDSPH